MATMTARGGRGPTPAPAGPGYTTTPTEARPGGGGARTASNIIQLAGVPTQVAFAKDDIGSLG